MLKPNEIDTIENFSNEYEFYVFNISSQFFVSKVPPSRKHRRMVLLPCTFEFVLHGLFLALSGHYCPYVLRWHLGKHYNFNFTSDIQINVARLITLIRLILH